MTTAFDRVTERREALNLSASALCEAAGLNKDTLANAKRNDGRLDLRTIEALAGPLGCTAPELLGYDTPAADPQRTRVAICDLRLSPINERTAVDGGELAALTDSILERGLLQELVAYAGDDGLYYVAEGGRRLRALWALDADGALPSILAEHGIPIRLCADEHEGMVLTVVANLHRADVNFVDRASAFARIRDTLATSAAEVARLVNASPRSVQMYLQIHDRLPAADKARGLRGEITYKQALDLVQQHQEPPPVRRTVPGEVGWPKDWACTGVIWRGERIEGLFLEHRQTGQRIDLRPAQLGIEDFTTGTGG